MTTFLRITGVGHDQINRNDNRSRTFKRQRHERASERALRVLRAFDVLALFIVFELFEVMRTLMAERMSGGVFEADPAVGVAKFTPINNHLRFLACLFISIVCDRLVSIVEDAAKHLRMIVCFRGLLVAEFYDIERKLEAVFANEFTCPLDL